MGPYTSRNLHAVNSITSCSASTNINSRNTSGTKRELSMVLQGPVTESTIAGIECALSVGCALRLEITALLTAISIPCS